MSEPDAAAVPAAPASAAWDGPLPEAVRLRVVALASETLGALPDEEVPAALRPFRRWAPTRRTKLAAMQLAVAVDQDAVFRQRVAARVRASHPDLLAALDNGAAPAAADPVEVATLAYIARTPDWAALVATAGADRERASAAAEAGRAAETVARLQESLAALRTEGREELSRVRSELEEARAETAALRAELRTERATRRRAEEEARALKDTAAGEVAAASAATASLESEVRRLRSRLEQADAAREAGRKAGRDSRVSDEMRLRLLLDTVVEAAAGLRRELALPPSQGRPADTVDSAEPGSAGDGEGARALLPDDPAVLDQLLALPQVHLVVDGYNVTKSAYPELPLEAQRSRLVGGLVALAARSGAEVTCCFDGAALAGRVPSLSGRGVRVLFSHAGETADELIRRLVRAEPEGRPVVVVSSDREVADGVRRAGARPVSSAALARRLDRS